MKDGLYTSFSPDSNSELEAKKLADEMWDRHVSCSSLDKRGRRMTSERQFPKPPPLNGESLPSHEFVEQQAGYCAVCSLPQSHATHKVSNTESRPK